MDDRTRASEERLAALETAVRELQAGLAGLRDALWRQQTGGPAPAGGPRPTPVGSQAGAAPPPPAEHPPARGRKRPQRRPRARPALPSFENTGEWLNRLGIALLLFGVAFLFKYSVDRGWLTPEVRVGLGLALAVALFGFERTLPASRRTFALVLGGGAVATLYITLFASFQLYELIPHALAFALMIGVTLLSFSRALREDEPLHSLIGAAGGFGTPFLLYTESGSLPALTLYTCVLLLATSAVYQRRRWKSLLYASLAGGWVVLAIAAFALHRDSPLVDVVSVQAGIVFAALCSWGLLLALALPRLGGAPESPPGRSWLEPSHQLAVSTPLLVLLLSGLSWHWSEEEAGAAALALALLWGGVGWLCARERLPLHAYTHAVVASLLLSLGIVLLLDGDSLVFTLAAQGAVLHALAARHGARAVGVVAHAIFAGTALLVLGRLLEGADAPALLNPSALTDLAVLGAAVAATRALAARPARAFYLLWVHAAVLAWLLRELRVFDNGQAWVSVSWGLYSVALLVAGLRLDRAALRQVAMATLLLIVAKLFVVDLGEVDPLLRTLLFMGFGASLLLLSYWFPALWKKEAPRDRMGSAPDEGTEEDPDGP